VTWAQGISLQYSDVNTSPTLYYTYHIYTQQQEHESILVDMYMYVLSVGEGDSAATRLEYI
jgi:hypothetical protein